MLQEQEYEREGEGEGEDEEEEPMFVLTDEWREFFAKSEAKRKLGTNFLSFLCFSLPLPHIFFLQI